MVGKTILSNTKHLKKKYLKGPTYLTFNRAKKAAKVVEMANEPSNLPDVNEAVEISIRQQKDKEGSRNRPSWNISDEEKSVMELMDEGADEIYENKSS